MLQVKSLVLFTSLVMLLCICTASSSTTINRRLIQVKIGPLVNCSAMTNVSMKKISYLIESALVTEINARCLCSFTMSKLIDGKFSCSKDLPHYPTYRVYIESMKGYTVQQLMDSVTSWVVTGPSVSDGVGTFSVDSSCPVQADSDNDPPCSAESESSVDVVLLVGVMITEFVVFLFVFAIIIAIITAVYSKRERKLKYSLKMRMQQPARKRLISCQSVRSSESSHHPDVPLQSCEAYMSI